ncbi:MAG: hypothetical protein ACYDCL_09465 [Myxococcales bacterium]
MRRLRELLLGWALATLASCGCCCGDVASYVCVTKCGEQGSYACGACPPGSVDESLCLTTYSDAGTIGIFDGGAGCPPGAPPPCPP